MIYGHEIKIAVRAGSELFQITALQIIMLWYELQHRGVGQKSMEHPVDLNCGRVE